MLNDYSSFIAVSSILVTSINIFNISFFIIFNSTLVLVLSCYIFNILIAKKIKLNNYLLFTLFSLNL